MRFSKMSHCGLRLVFALVVGTTMMVGCVPSVMAKDAKQTAFRRVFGEAARLDPVMVAKVKKLGRGKRLMVDRDGDGRKDEVWFMDTARRHTVKPLLVRVVDEDGDLEQLGRPDLDSDLYIADYGADGTVDSVVDYQDNDGDGDVDEMGIYYWQGKPRKGVLRVWWNRDDGDDNLLLYDVNYNYNQRLCQYRCHLSGEETVVSLHLPADSDRWISFFENPFVFYDPDGDRCSEVVVRFTGTNNRVETLRYSFDADDDAHGRWVHDYDFSVSAWAEGLNLRMKSPTGHSKLKFDDQLGFTTKLRGISTTNILRHDAAQQFAREARWARACLTWDEMNANTDENVRRDPARRWEGVLAKGSNSFPQIGGPPCSRLNKRYEIMRPARPLRLYYDPTDRRLHLLGAGAAEGWLGVDYDLDGKIDAKYTYVDENGDGIFDRRQIDLDADGTPEFNWKMRGTGARQVNLEYQSLSTFYKQVLAETLEESQCFIDAAKAALGDRVVEPDPVETFFLTKLESWYPLEGLGRRMRSTPAGARYYVDLVRDRLFGKLKERLGKHPAWPKVESAYAAGDYAKAAELVLARLAPGAKVAPAARFRSFTRWIPVSIDNTGGPWRDHWPVTLTVKDLRAVADDFNPDNCAVVAPDRWLDWREIPHQLDEIDPAAGRQLSFLARVLPDSRATWYVYYSPEGKRKASFPRKTGTDVDWDPTKVNIGWESTVGAYRIYDGHMDFFGKHTYAHSRKVEWLIYPIKFNKNENYHNEMPWGIDALHVNDTPGLGGLALVVDGKVHPVRNPGCKGHIKFNKRMLTSGPVRAAVEVTARNVVPAMPDLSVRMLFVIYAEHQESEVRAKVTGGPPSMLLAPGLTRLPREEAFVDRSLGCVGSWGWQEDKIGEIGMGVMVPPDRLKDVVDLADQRRFHCTGADGALRYWIIGDWRRGRRFPVGRTIANWQAELKELAAGLHSQPKISVGSPEQLP